MSIGNIETARMLFNHFGGGSRWLKRAPNGYNRIGMGIYRAAYLEKSTNTVYKIGDYECNVHEASMSRKLASKSKRALGFELIIPKTRTFRMPNDKDGEAQCVIAQQYASDAKNTYCHALYEWMDKPCNCHRNPCYADVLETIASWSELDDIHEANVLIDKSNRFWLVDMGC